LGFGTVKAACTLDGTYALNLSVACGPNVPAANCSLSLPSDFVASVVYTLQSENFCATMTVDVGIVGNIRSYVNQSFDAYPPSTAFIVGRSAYYLIKVNSDLNDPKDANGNPDPDLYQASGSGTVVTFATVSLINVAISFSNGTLVRVWENGAPVNWASHGFGNYGTNAAVYYVDANNNPLVGNEVGFSFVVVRALIPVPKDAEISITIVADVQVTYSNTQKKRFGLTTAGADNNTYSLSSTVADSANATTDTATATTSATTTSPTTSTTTTTSPTTVTSPTTSPTTTSKSSTTSLPTTQPSSAISIFAMTILMLFSILM